MVYGLKKFSQTWYNILFLLSTDFVMCSIDNTLVMKNVGNETYSLNLCC